MNVALFFGSRAGSSLRSIVMGVHLSIGEIGGSGASAGDVGDFANRPPIAAVAPSESVTVTPRSEIPDLPEPAKPTISGSPVAPAAPEVSIKPAVPERAAEPAAPSPVATPAAAAPTSSRIAALRTAIRAALSGLRGIGAENLNAEWLELKRRIRAGLPDTPENRELLKLLDKAYAAVRSPKLIEDTMIAVWDRAQHDNISTTEALVRMAGEGQQLHVIAAGAGILDFDEFRAGARSATGPSSTMSSRPMSTARTRTSSKSSSSPAPSADARQQRDSAMIANASGPDVLIREDAQTGERLMRPFWSQVWDAIFDAAGADQINAPEGIGPVLHEVIGIEGPPRPPRP